MGPLFYHSQVAMLRSCDKVMEITMVLELCSWKAHC